MSKTQGEAIFEYTSFSSLKCTVLYEKNIGNLMKYTGEKRIQVRNSLTNRKQKYTSTNHYNTCEIFPTTP